MPHLPADVSSPFLAASPPHCHLHKKAPPPTFVIFVEKTPKFCPSFSQSRLELCVLTASSSSETPMETDDEGKADDKSPKAVRVSSRSSLSSHVHVVSCT